MIESSPIQIPAEHPSYPGHFPGMPILPGVVLLDEALYAIEAACKLDLAHCQIASAKFQGVVRPGDALGLEHEALANGSIRFTIRTQGRSVATGMLLRRPAQSADANAV
jgi:3-hydroxyacyl-[acyl-carrier-protein] dehydratase